MATKWNLLGCWWWGDPYGDDTSIFCNGQVFSLGNVFPDEVDILLPIITITVIISSDRASEQQQIHKHTEFRLRCELCLWRRDEAMMDDDCHWIFHNRFHLIGSWDMISNWINMTSITHRRTVSTRIQIYMWKIPTKRPTSETVSQSVWLNSLIQRSSIDILTGNACMNFNGTWDIYTPEFR